MTSTTDTTRHPDVSEISDLTEGLLPPSRAAEVRSHVDGCELCGDVHSSLMEIRELLGTVPTPQHMPDDVADRIDTALAAEALGTAAPVGAVHVSRETEPSVAQRPETELSLPDRPAGRPRAATGPGRRPAWRRRTAVLGTAFGAAVVGVGVFMLQNVQPSQEDASLKAADRGSSSAAKGAGTFSASTLESRVQTLLLSAGTEHSHTSGTNTEKNAPPSVDIQSTPKSDSPRTESPQTPLRAPTVSVPTCVKQGIGRTTAALAVEEGTYEGSDAFLVVLPHPSDATRVQAYVVDAACVQEKPAAKGQVLLTHAYARP
ncbi:anti-sigma factor family protein [Streptomyces sp. NPDC056930]|uniref:anti-sigma factor family protein n=1 Tax=Streptomyces sp. NPDC056930 TaxID=3345967 RepID=UPI003633CDB0